MFGAILDQADRGVAGSFQTLVHDLEASGVIGQVGDEDLRGHAYLFRLRDLGNTAIPHDAEVGRRQIKIASTYREARAVIRRAAQALENPDSEVMLDTMAEQATLLELLVNDSGIDLNRALPGLRTINDLLAVPDEARRWVIPGLLERQDRVLLVGEEGHGKSTLGRQVALCAAAGVHPFAPTATFPAVRTLIVDFENSASPRCGGTYGGRWRRWTVRAAGDALGDRCRIWNWPSGVDVRSPGGRSMLIRAIEQSTPSLVIIGPLYKMAEPRKGESWEEQAAHMAHAIDSLRQRYDVAFWIEHHMPKAQDGRRVDPVGSGLWKRWPEFGVRMDTPGPKDDQAVYKLGRFRGDRDASRRWPDALDRGGRLPWTGHWDDGEGLADVYRECDFASS